MAIKSSLTRLKELSAYPKTKKGDVVVIELTSSYTTAKFKKVQSVSYYLAKVTKTSEGLAQTYRKANGVEGIVDSRHRVHVISDPELQDRTRHLFSTELGTMDFDDLDQVKKAILGRN
jgi:hypothetical protein